MKNAPIPIVRSAPLDIKITLKNADGTPTNLTGATIEFVVKNRKTPFTYYDTADSVTLIRKTVTSHTQPTQGKTTITLDPEDTENLVPEKYVYGIRVTPATGQPYPSGIAIFEVKARGA